ncbi:hypothetical protein SISNIDRAFT_484940 [Sistotremastrum niveocremeum HHB9708]|uniref:Protein kinase domain-containing protein n=1 Tax=Sistotremastrum niveocremeum HHB9708 TaxID=1314777 RepID=A0A164VAK2_9AGAM|nr:hypothetical protein SISNIDRAFT_484940 [Sistotremastrum niveocremeum HHB9708]
MSREVLIWYRRAARKDPNAVPRPQVDDACYNPPNPEKETLLNYIDRPPKLRKLRLQKVTCLDHSMQGSSSDARSSIDHHPPNPQRTRVFRASAQWETSPHDRLVVLKILPAADPTSTDIYAYDQFEHEAACYARLRKAGLCDAGYVPHCYGWYQFPSSWATQPSFAPLAAHPRMADVVESKTPPRAILIEYLRDASPVSPWNITVDIAHEALRRLTEIHSIGILHSDVFPRNLLITGRGLPVWIDFGVSSITPVDYQVRRDTQADEYDTLRFTDWTRPDT